MNEWMNEYLNVHSKSMFATTVWLPYKQNEGISVPKDRAIRICRRHGHIPHLSVWQSYMLYILISFISLHLGRISELERKILSPCRNNIESALYPMWTFYNFCDASTMDWIHWCAHPVSSQLQCLPVPTTEASQGHSKQFSNTGRGKWISEM